MQAINFLYKVKVLKDKLGESKTEIVVFDSLQNYTHKMLFEGLLGETEVKYHLQTCEKLKYKNFQVYFTRNTTVKF